MITLVGLKVTLFQVFATVGGIGVLVFIHELGHFIVAKLFKLKVLVFAFGFGPELLGFTYKETRYQICLIPLGGMVKMPGEDAGSADGTPDEFLSQPWYKRFLITLCGPIMNYLLAAFLFAFIIFNWGISKPVMSPIIGEVVQDYPAALAGIKPDDKIISINGKAITDWQNLASDINSNSSQAMNFVIMRSTQQVLLTITAKKDPVTGKGLIGISPKFEVERFGALTSAGLGFKMIYVQSYQTLKYLGEKLLKMEKPELAGPIGVIQIMAKAAKSGWENYLYLLALISTALGLFNLLPIPLLDGGHMLMAVVEAIIRKPVNKKVLAAFNYVGLTIILMIFLYATYSDIIRSGLFFKKPG